MFTIRGVVGGQAFLTTGVGALPVPGCSRFVGTMEVALAVMVGDRVGGSFACIMVGPAREDAMTRRIVGWMINGLLPSLFIRCCCSSCGCC
uniref:Putative secreted protein n=1 Tax=Anopheles darlingi TaxID=43151 RepID=A0A2M4DEV6_ANODA